MSAVEPAVGAALPGEPCRVPPHDSWSDLEKWVWHEIGSGRIADINTKLGMTADPRKPEHWGPERRLSASFLETILLYDPWRSAIPRQGVRIGGAWFDETVNLAEAEIAQKVWLGKSRFISDVRLSGIRTKSLLALSDSVITGTLDMDAAHIDGALSMSDGAEFAEVLLRSARIGDTLSLIGAKVAGLLDMASASIGGQLDMTGANVAGTLDMDAARVGEDLFMREGAEFTEVILRGARIKSQLSLIGAKVTGTLDMDGASIGGPLFMRDGAEFTEVILRSAQIGGMLDLSGAKVIGTLDAEFASIGGSLSMSDNAEFTEVVLRGAKIEGVLSLISSKVTDTLDMGSASVGRGLFMREGAEFAEVILRGAKIGDPLDLSSAKVTGTLDMDAVSIGGDLSMSHGAEFAEVLLRDAHIGGQLDMTGAMVTGTLNMDGASIGGSLFMSGARVTGTLDMDGVRIGGLLLMGDGAEFAEVDLRGATIGDDLELDEAKVVGPLTLESIRIGGHLFMRGGHYSQDVQIIFAEITRSLDLSRAAVASLDLTASRMSALSLASVNGPLLKWAVASRLVLRNTRAKAIQDHPCAWPSMLDLDGFSYERFGGFDGGASADVGSRGSKWFINWLAKDESYTPQPYHQCAKVLREMGHPEIADDVLYAGRERERQAALRNGNNPRATGLLLLKLFVGYGHGRRMLWHPLGWVFGLTVVGTAILHFTGVPKEPRGSAVTPWFFSFDLLLPIIQLHEPHYKVVLDDVAKYYFAFHKLMGYVLASFLIAGLAGLTK